MIDADGSMLGVIPTAEAKARAKALGLDLVEVSPKANPPVCKIVDFGKLQYENDKQLRKNKAQAKKAGGGEIKGIRLSMKISDHDMMVRVNAAQKFLDKGNKVKLEIRMRGREKAHPERGTDIMEKFAEVLDRDVTFEQKPKRQGGSISAMISMTK